MELLVVLLPEVELGWSRDTFVQILAVSDKSLLPEEKSGPGNCEKGSMFGLEDMELGPGSELRMGLEPGESWCESEAGNPDTLTGHTGDCAGAVTLPGDLEESTALGLVIPSRVSGR